MAGCALLRDQHSLFDAVDEGVVGERFFTKIKGAALDRLNRGWHIEVAG
jgi:hypothetical protein